MKAPYVCVNTLVRMTNGKEGYIIGVDRQARIATIKTDTTFCTERVAALTVVSYERVDWNETMD